MKDTGFTTAIGCVNGDVYIRNNWDALCKRYDIFGESKITEIKFGMDNTMLVVCTQDKDLYLLSLNDNGEYVKMKSLKTQDGFPISVNFDGEYSRLLILTSNWKFTVVNLDKFTVSGLGDDDLNRTFWVYFKGKYVVSPKTTSTVANVVNIGIKNNFVISSDELNNIHMWRNPQHVSRNSGNVYKVHSSHVQNIIIVGNDEYVVSAGMNDKMICKWKVKSLFNDSNAEMMQMNHHQMMNYNNEHNDDVNINDMNLIAELNYSFISSSNNNSCNSSNSDDDCIDNNVVVRGFSNAQLNNIFSRPLTQLEKETLLLPVPSSLLLEYIYGSHICEKRNSVMYLHTFKQSTLPKVQKDANVELIKQILNEHYEKKTINEIIKEINFNKTTDKTEHKFCSKSIIYYNGRFAIIFFPEKKVQKVYQGHKHKISSLTINSKHSFIASGEATRNPLILVWKVETLETQHIIQTGHQQGILHLEFSKNDKYLLSIGFGLIYSLQVFCLEFLISPIFVNLGTFPIYAVKAFTSCEYKFITLGYKNITIWKIKGNTLLKVKHIETEENKEITVNNNTYSYVNSMHPNTKMASYKIFLCCAFLDYTLGNSIETDIIIGSNYGDITGISCNKYILLKTNAHNGAINNIISTDKIKGKKYFIITTGEDALIKLWDQFYNIIRIINVYTIGNISYLQSTTLHESKGIQSLDIYTCERGVIYFLVGLRTGDLTEIIIHNPTELVKTQNISNTTKTESNELNVLFNHIYSYPYSYALNIKYYRMKIAVHPLLPIAVIASIDQTIRLYDFERKEIISVKNVGASATCISFSPDGKLLAIGTIYGKVLIINAEINEEIKNNKSLGFKIPSLEPIQYIQLSNTTSTNNVNVITPVLLAKFSTHGDFLAISYDNKYTDEGKPQGGNMLTIYMLRLSKKLQVVNKGGKRHGQTSNDLYLKYCDIIIPDNQYQLTNLNKVETATTGIDFSEDDLFLLLTHQQLSFTKEVSNKNYIFFVWDLAKNQITVNQEKIHSLNFPKFTTSNAIYCKNVHSLYTSSSSSMLNNNNNDNYFNYTNNNNNNEDDHLFYANVNANTTKESSLLSSIWQSLNSFTSIGGGINGVLYLFRSYAFIFDSELISNFSISQLNVSHMASARAISAHVGAISSIESTTDENFIFTASSLDQNIIQWFLMHEDSFWDLDFYPIPLNTPDPFMDVPSFDVFKALKASTWKNRLNLIDTYNVAFDENTKTNLDLIYIYGRRANDKRNNLHYDNSNRIIYSVASYIVFLTTSTSSSSSTTSNSGEMLQEFFVPVENINNEIQMEISTFTLSADKKEIVVAFNGIVSAISLWELSTQLCLGKIIINNCSVINIVKYSYNKRNIIGYGLHKDYYPIVFIVDAEIHKVIASTVLIQSLPCKIKDMDYVSYNTSDEFYTVGIQHMAYWNVRGSHLEYRNIPLKILKNTNDEIKEYTDHHNNNTNNFFNELDEINDENKYGCYLLVEDKSRIDQVSKIIYRENPDTCVKCSFLNIATFNNFSILSADDGCLYTLEKVDLTTKTKYHNSPIIALQKNTEMNFLISGSMDGTVMLFKVDHSHKLKLFKIFRTIDQSVDVPLKEILSAPENNVQAIAMGMNKIAVGTKSGDIFEFQITDDMQIINPNTLNMPIRKVNFQDHDPPISITLDNTSSFFYSITSKGLLSVWDIKKFICIYSYDFRVNAKYIYHFKYQNKLLIAFENFISVLDTSENEQFKKLPIYDLQTGEINDVKVSPNEKLIAIGSLIANSNPVLDIYDIVNGFVHKNQIQNLNTRIKFLDFSKESTYLLLEDYLEEVLVIDIHQKTVISSKSYFDMEWTGDGLKYSENLKNIHHVYEDELRHCTIVRHPVKNIVAIGDNLGCIRLFKYPALETDKCFLCRTDHIGKINNIYFSFDNNYLITSSEADKAAFIYRISE